MPYTPPPEIAALSLAELADAVAARKLPPLERWSPAHQGDSEMRIAADGTWYHQGSPIARPAMVRAFAGLLMRDAQGAHWLVTPNQKLSIEVEDAAFIATDVTQRDGTLAFRLNTDEVVLANAQNRIEARGSAETPALYLQVRRGCEARLNRSTYLQLAELADGDWNVASAGETFALRPR